MKTNAVKKERNGNIELLRMLSMAMVVTLHALGKGGLLQNLGALSIFAGMSNGEEVLSATASVNAVIAWILEALALSAVNIFMLISGYFLIDSSFRLKRLISLLCQLLFYSVGVFAVCMIAGVPMEEPVDTYFILRNVFPLHMDVYWFMTAYIVLYMLLPVLSQGVKNISQKQFGTVLIALIIYECIFKSVLPVRLTVDKAGYSLLWFVIMFLTGAYFKLYGFKHLTTTGRGTCLYFCASALIFLEKFALDLVKTYTGHLKDIATVSTEYNHIFVLLASIGIFAAFVQKAPMGSKASRIICALSPYSLGVYLFHESIAIRYSWTKFLGLNGLIESNPFVFSGRILLAIVTIYVVGLFLDFLRAKIFSLLKLS